MTQRGSRRTETKLIKASVSPRHYREFSGMLKCTSTTTLTPKVLLITANVFFAKFSLLLANSRWGGGKGCGGRWGGGASTKVLLCRPSPQSSCLQGQWGLQSSGVLDHPIGDQKKSAGTKIYLTKNPTTKPLLGSDKTANFVTFGSFFLKIYIQHTVLDVGLTALDHHYFVCLVSFWLFYLCGSWRSFTILRSGRLGTSSLWLNG